MSWFKLVKRSALSRCYDILSNNDKKKRSSAVPDSSTAGVIDKLHEAERKEQASERYQATPHHQAGVVPIAGPINSDFIEIEIEGPAQKSGTVTGQALNHDSSEASDRDSPPEASAGITQRKKMAEILTNPQELWERFFSGVICDAALSAVEENLDEFKSELCSSLEFRKASERGDHRFAQVCDFPLKLLLTPMKRGRRLANTFASLLEMQYGPLHAALQVGNVILEWNDSDLVAPYLCAWEEQIMKVDMQPYSEWVNYTGKHHSEMKKAAEKRDYPEQIELIYTVTSKKKELIDNLIEVIVRYNRHYYYNLFDRNCQHFVSDALQALQVNKPAEFTGDLKKYFDSLVKGRTPSVPSQFKTHCELDDYVIHIKQVSRMPQNDLELILALYFRFHLESKSKLKDDSKALEGWKCEFGNCRMNDIEQLIQMESMQIHKFCIIGNN